MPRIFDGLDDKKARDLRVLSEFVAVFCREKHRMETKEAFAINDSRLQEVLGGKNIMLCRECSKLLNHGIARLLLCSYDPKLACKK